MDGVLFTRDECSFQWIAPFWWPHVSSFHARGCVPLSLDFLDVHIR